MNNADQAPTFFERLAAAWQVILGNWTVVPKPTLDQPKTFVMPGINVRVEFTNPEYKSAGNGVTNIAHFIADALARAGYYEVSLLSDEAPREYPIFGGKTPSHFHLTTPIAVHDGPPGMAAREWHEYDPRPNLDYAIRTLYDVIKSSEPRHQEWLKAAIEAHFAGKPIPKEKVAPITAPRIDGERPVKQYNNVPREMVDQYNHQPDEPFFVLLGRDPQAPDIVEGWAMDRLAATEHFVEGEDVAGNQLKVGSAVNIAAAMRRWKRTNPELGMRVERYDAVKRAKVL